MPQISIIRTGPEHPDFIELVKQLDVELAKRDGDDHAFYAQFNKTGQIRNAVVAYDNEQVVGCGAIKNYDPDTMEIKRMYTAPGHRGKGIATRILTELENWAGESGFQRCILETGINQPEAIELYTKTGYVRVPNYGQYAGVQASFCFEKRLG